ncbi:MAG: T9SS type A sorting domain-containing protein [Rhodothermus sp.]|nr:T9SS type A sorting domain-containing protein [Rhodothermus sp.]
MGALGFKQRRGVLLIGLVTASIATAQTVPVEGIDCACVETGAYKRPDKGKAPALVEDPQYANRATSPNGLYALSVKGGGGSSVTLTIVRVSSGEEVLRVSFNSADLRWGFSPDDHRFVVWGVDSAEQQRVLLYDLEQGSSNPVQRYELTQAGPSVVRFSDQGHYLLYVVVTDPGDGVTGRRGQVFMSVSARDGRIAYQASHSLHQAGQPGDKVGGMSWGFSPDTQDRTLAYVVDTGPNSVSWYLVNLAAGQVVQAQPISNVSGAAWRFAPCGDVIGLVLQSGATQMQITLFRTRNGEVLTSQTTKLVPYELRSTDTHHVLRSGGNDTELAVNAAPQACVTVSLSLAPSEVVGGEVVTGTLILAVPAPAGGKTFTLSSNSAAVQLPGSVTVATGNTSESFTIITQAVAADETVTITATDGSVQVSAALVVRAGMSGVQLVSLALETTSVTGGTRISGTVAVNRVVPAGGVLIALSVDHESATVNQTVEIEEGALQATFTVRTEPVRTTTSVTLTATYGASNQTASFLIYPPVIADVQLDPDSVVGGASVSGTVTLSGPAPSGNWTAWLTSDNPQIVELEADSLIFWEGTTQGFFSLQTRGVSQDTTVRVVVSQFIYGLDATIVVRPADLERLTYNPLASPCLLELNGRQRWGAVGGFPIVLDLVLNGEAPPEGAIIQLQSTDPTRVRLTPTVSFPARARQVSITAQTSPVDEPVQADLIAFYRDRKLSETLDLMPAPRQYRVTDIGFAPGTAHNRPEALNNYGQVVGMAGMIPYIWSMQEGLQPLPLPESSTSVRPVDVNDHGWIVGFATSGLSQTQPVLWRNGILKIWDQSGTFVAVNNRGQFAGAGADGIYRWSGEAPERLRLSEVWDGATLSMPYRGLNERGEVLGIIQRATSWARETHGIVWREGERPLFTFRFWTAGATGIPRFNSAGTIVAPLMEAYQYQDQIEAQFAYPILPGYVFMYPTAVTSTGEVVGNARFEDEEKGMVFWRAFWASAERAYALECLVVPEESRRLDGAVDINEAGQILAYTRDDWLTTYGRTVAAEDSTYAYLLTPATLMPADLGVTVSAERSTVVLGDSVVYLFQVTNQGGKDVPAVRLLPVLAVGLEPLSIAATQGSCVVDYGQHLRCALGTITSGASVTVTVGAQPTVPGRYLSYALVSGAGLDTVLANNKAEIELVVQPSGSRTATVTVAADETGTFDLSEAGLLITFTEGSTTDGSLTAQQRFEAPENAQRMIGITVQAPSGAIVADTVLTEWFWTVEAPMLSGMTYTVCLNISSLSQMVDPGTLVITRRATDTEAWRPHDSYARLVGNVVYLCTDGLTAFSEFALATSREMFSVVVTPGAEFGKAPYQISQIYPNPTRRWIHFTLHVREGQPVRIELFDILGRRIAVLYQGKLDAARPYHFRFDGDRWASGLYVLRVVGEQFQTVQRILRL